MLFIGRLYIWDMKNESIKIKDTVFADVYRMTANAAKSRGDDKFVATEDDIDLLKQFETEGKVILDRALGRYGIGSLKYSVPENWDFSEEVNDLASVFMAEYLVARWMALGGNEVALPVIDLMPILNKRKKPI